MKRARTRDMSAEAAGEEESAVKPKKKIKVQRVCKFREFNLKELGLPEEAWPLKDKIYAGKKGFTIVGSNQAVTWKIEINLHSRVQQVKGLSAYKTRSLRHRSRSRVLVDHRSAGYRSAGGGEGLCGQEIRERHARGSETCEGPGLMG